MIRSHRNSLAAILLTATLATAHAPVAIAGPADGEVTTFIVVRHAEKQKGPDPALTAKGRARARELARLTTDAGIAAVYSTPYRRTRETAAPAAAAAGVEIREDSIRTDDISAYYAGFVGTLLERHRGQRVLIVGHSNTAPVIVAAFGAEGAPELGEGDYDDLFVVTVSPSGEADLLHLHYGNVTP